MEPFIKRDEHVAASDLALLSDVYRRIGLELARGKQPQ